MQKLKSILLIIYCVTIAAVSIINAQTNVVCIGNSITWGSGLSDRINECYPSQLGALLGGDFDVENRGEGGTTLLQNTWKPYIGSQQWEYSIATPHAIVIILLGTNDSDEDTWVEKDHFKEDYFELIGDYLNYDEYHEDPVFILGLPPPVFDESAGHRNEPIVSEIIPMIKQIASETGSTIADFYNALDGKPELFVDGVHPNEVGASIMAEVAYDAIQKALATSDIPYNHPPDTPTGLKTIPGLTNINLEWHANTENDLLSYTIFRSNTDGGWQDWLGSVLKTDTTFTDNNVIINHIYYYSINAVDDHYNASSRSAPIAGKTIDITPPSAPINLQVILEADSVKLSWAPNTELDVEKYYIYRNSILNDIQQDLSIIGTVYAPDSNFSYISFDSAINYFYGVTAVDISGNQGLISNVVNITTKSRPISSDTTLTSFENVSHHFKASDFPFFDADNDSLDKIIFINTDQNDYFTYDSDSITSPLICDDISKLVFTPNLDELGENYAEFSFKVVDSFGSTSIDTNIVTIHIIDITPPSAPINLQVILEADSVKLSWAPNTELDVEKYFIYRNSTLNDIQQDLSFIGTVYAPDSNFSYISFDSAINYFYGVTAVDISGNQGLISNVVNITTKSRPISSDTTLTSFENVSHHFKASEFPFFDADNDFLDKIIFINTDQNDYFTYDSDPITSPLICDDISKLVFTPNLDEFGENYAEFSFKVVDSFGSTSIDTNIVTIHINDKPRDFNIITPISDSTLVINKSTYLNTFSISWEESSDSINNGILYDIVFTGDLSALSQYRSNSTNAEYVLKNILSITDTVSIASGTFSIIASDGELQTRAINSAITITVDGRSFAPPKLHLDQNYPNPFNNTTVIGFDLPKSTDVSIIIYDLLGEEVIKLIKNKKYERGYNTITWNGLDKNNNQITTGIYIMQIRTGSNEQHKKLVYIK